ncbi:hypothetical protein [Lysobacter sp. GCM10012299]|uniref:hypothetical protein n=1 Tax=Lysobacter sp. GCM10012299 TaxID=3317333 RepID=UPI00361CC8A0
MTETYPVCLTLRFSEHWLAWYSDATGHDRFVEANGALVWTNSERSLSNYLIGMGGWKPVSATEEVLRLDVDELLRSLENGTADYEELITLWNLFTDLSNASTAEPVFPFAREAPGAKQQYDALFSRTNAGWLLDKSEEPVDFQLIGDILNLGVTLLERRLGSGFNPEHAC